MQKDSDIAEPSEINDFSWDVLEYTKDFIKLKIDFKNPEDLGAFASKDFITVTFWGVEFFKDYTGIEVEFGT